MFRVRGKKGINDTRKFELLLGSPTKPISPQCGLGVLGVLGCRVQGLRV